MHNIEHWEFKATKKTSEISSQINAYVREETVGEGGSGLYYPIRFIDKTFDTYDEAKEYIENNDRGNYDQLAVKYRNCSQEDLLSNKKYKELLELVNANNREVYNFKVAPFLKTLKSGFFTCKECGCKIPTKRWVENYCPVCKNDLRSDTFHKQLKAKQDRLENLKTKLSAEEKRISSKSNNIYWLVKFEYHT